MKVIYGLPDVLLDTQAGPIPPGVPFWDQMVSQVCVRCLISLRSLPVCVSVSVCLDRFTQSGVQSGSSIDLRTFHALCSQLLAKMVLLPALAFAWCTLVGWGPGPPSVTVPSAPS